MKSCFLFLCLGMFQSAFPQVGQAVPVFRSGTDGYSSFRIPAIIRLPNHELLAFAEGRVHDAGDYGNIDIVMKSSFDNGRSWSALQVAVDAGNLQAGNPAPVVDRTDPKFPKGRIFLFYNTGNNTEQQVRMGNGLREAWYISSIDQGKHWSAPVNITSQVHRPKEPQLNPGYNFREDWRSYANTPGHAMQFLTGNFRGRIFIAANHSAGSPMPDFSDYHAHGYYTDDHGSTFRLGENVAVPGSNESMAAELPDGMLMMNSRNQRGDIRKRIVSISKDGGQTWDTSYFDTNLVDPVCQGSILNIHIRGRNALAFCNAADTSQRNNLTLRVSFDQGRSWEQRYLIEAGSDSTADHAAYSDIEQSGPAEIGVLYERNDYNEIVFKTIRIRPKP